ncbi:unnamed protein product [Psylliodes chrysocephalus]|uniref:DUF4371 domain-containing protein n=1 Tax=Psylliodes chrysocephalus TaxID=3402493 RepID=A0A9P0D5Q1_9CUCU|nr:unnamed protein product [Psylliodes chrysocephala]
MDHHLKISNKIHNERVKENRDVSQRLIDVTCFLGKHELSFRGHNEASGSANRGNYMDLLSFLAKYDDTLKNYFIDSTTFRGLFYVISERTADALFKVVCDIISSVEYSSKLVAQSYDGAAVMAGYLGGLQAKVKEKFKHAIFVHCIAHRLNLVLSRSMDNIKDCKVFFSTLSGLSSFFSKSSKRTRPLDIHVQKRFPKVVPSTNHPSHKCVS